MPDAVLTLNAGSSSIKFALFETVRGRDGVRVLQGEIEGVGSDPHFTAVDPEGAVLADRRWRGARNHEHLLGEMLDWIDGHLGVERLVAVGHRVVHGGVHHTDPVRVTPALLRDLARLVPLAPLHQPHNLAAIEAIAATRPALEQVACFDTAFHRTMPDLATRFALPEALTASGVRRYGFHGLSYEFIAARLQTDAPALAAGRVIVAHLGGGASLCAMSGGKSIDSTMGFTALDGLPMGTRCGALDPGVVLHLMEHEGMTRAEIEDVLYHRSGLFGVSGLSSDMRVLSTSDDPRARLAIDLLVYRIARETGALASSLGGLDGFVFTAGIGEHQPGVRAGVSVVSPGSASRSIRVRTTPVAPSSVDPKAASRSGPSPPTRNA